MITPLGECAAWHEAQAQMLEQFQAQNADDRHVREIALHRKFAQACAEADGDEGEHKRINNIRRHK